MQAKRLLMQLCGQPRVITPSIFWQMKFVDELVVYARRYGYDLKVDWRYDLWDRMGCSQVASLGTDLDPVNKEHIEQQILNSVPADIKWYGYELVDDIFNTIEVNSDFRDSVQLSFHRTMSQSIIRALACSNIPHNQYDLAIMCRTDNLLFYNCNDQDHINLFNFCMGFFESDNVTINRYNNEYRSEYFIYSEYVEQRSGTGIGTGDQVFISSGNGFRCLYTDYRINIKEFIENITSDFDLFMQYMDPHHVASAITSTTHNKREWLHRGSNKKGLPHRDFPIIVAYPFHCNFYTILRPQYCDLAMEINQGTFKQANKGWKMSLK
jgi:hypothetical protein